MAKTTNLFVSPGNSLLSAAGIEAEGLVPKQVDIFLMPHAEVPDRVVYLSNQARILQPVHWKEATSSHGWALRETRRFPRL